MADFKFDQELVRALLQQQHPDLAELELRDVPGGWGNQVWRLGSDLGVRLPRTERAPALLEAEQKWLAALAGQLPLPTPTPVRIGEPSDLFPHTWTITNWVHGEPADVTPISSPGSAKTLADFLTALHQTPADDAPPNATRGHPLADLNDGFNDYFQLIAEDEEADAARAVWEDALAGPAWQGPPILLHGDLHPANVVVQDGMLAGVLDFGELCAGDPATDLSAAWILLPAGSAHQFFDLYAHADSATIARARAWAVMRGLNLLYIGQRGAQRATSQEVVYENATS